jgi:deoxyribodipyrimidine photolyase
VGEAYFAEKLDYEIINNEWWQWAAGTGCDATLISESLIHRFN